MSQISNEAQKQTDQPRVLVIDDSETMRSYTVSLLQAKGISALTAVDGEAGLYMFMKHPEIELAFVDVSMPRLDGISMVEQLTVKKAALGLKLPTIIMLTTENSKVLADRVRRAGGMGWVIKPITPEAMDGILTRFFKNKAAAP